MKITKSYTVRIDGNKSKIDYLHQQLSEIQKLSEFAYSLGKENWEKLTPLYNRCREEFPSLKSKVVQNFLRFHFTTSNSKMKTKKPPKASILVDYQSCGLRIDENTQLSNYWIRFHRKNFPLFGKILLKKIQDPKELKLIQIFERKNKLYCKLTVSKEVVDFPTPNTDSNSIGLDVNSKRVVLSNNDFYSLKRHHHRKIEHYKNNQKDRNTQNCTKDTLHKMTTIIANNLQKNEIEVLFLENLRNLRRSSSKKLGTSKGKKLNYIINSLPYRTFQNFLEYKCLDRGINVVYVNPAYTSKQCSRCGSLNTSRKQTSFRCEACGFKLDADLNGSRNIQERYYLPEWATSESNLLSDLKSVGSCVL